jgi:hypothetical protein
LDTFGVAKGNVASKVQSFESQSEELSPNQSRKLVSPVQSKSTSEDSPRHPLPKPSTSTKTTSKNQIRASKSNRPETDSLLSRLRQMTPPPAQQSSKHKLNTSSNSVERVPLDDALGM